MEHKKLSLILIISIFILIAISFGVYLNFSHILNIDLYINSLYFNNFWVNIFSKITQIVDPYPFIIVLAVISVVFILRRKINDLYLLMLSSGLGLSFSSILKNVFKRERPGDNFIDEETFSFPSNHSAVATILGLSIIFSFLKSIKKPLLRRFLIGITIFISLLICISRLVLKVHWLSDVVAGVALGVASFFISSLFFNKTRK